MARFGFQSAGQSPTDQKVDEEPSDSIAASALLRFMTRVDVEARGELLALSIEDHYLNVYTSNGHAKINYSLAEAVTELENAQVDGLRIHRSHWVAKQALGRVVSDGHGYVAHVSNGLELPVGPTYVGLLKSVGALFD